MKSASNPPGSLPTTTRRGTTNLPAKIRTQSEVIHDTPDALEAKETVEAVIEVVRELPKTLEAEKKTKEEVALQSESTGKRPS